MRIAFVTDVIYPYVMGGAERRIFEMSTRLAASGNDVHVFGVKWWDGPSTMAKDGITYHGVCKPMKLYKGGRRSIKEAVVFGAALTLPLLKERFDVIDCNQHPYFSVFSCRLATAVKGGKLFVTWHEAWGDYWYKYLGRLGFFGKIVEKAACMASRKAIAVSGSTASSLMALGMKNSRIILVPNGVSIEEIARSSPAGVTYDVAFAGRLIKDKNVDLLLHALAAVSSRIPGVRAIIAGDGPERGPLEALSESLNIKASVNFAGIMEEGAMASMLKSSKVFVLPSTREGFSITTLEALACGVPVVTVDHPANAAKDLVEDGMTGLVVPVTAEGLEMAILTLLMDEQRRRAMSARCAASVKGFDLDVLSTKLMEAYRQG